MENHFLILGDCSHVQRVRGECHFLNKQEQENGYLLFFPSTAVGTKNGKKGEGGGERGRGAPTDTFDKRKRCFYFCFDRKGFQWPPPKPCSLSEWEGSPWRPPSALWPPLPAQYFLPQDKNRRPHNKEETRNSSIRGFLSEAIR